VDGEKCNSLKQIFDTVKSVQICTESTDLMNQDFSGQPRAWKHGGIASLATMRPTYESDLAWKDEVVKTIKTHKVAIVVTTSVAPSGLACWLTKKTSELPL
jgi:hypothetical protein